MAVYWNVSESSILLEHVLHRARGLRRCDQHHIEQALGRITVTSTSVWAPPNGESLAIMVIRPLDPATLTLRGVLDATCNLGLSP